MRIVLFGLLLVINCFGFSTPSLADGKAKSCDNAQIINSIINRFHRQSFNVHRRNLSISQITNIHEHRAFDKSESNPIARRYCGGTALLSNGSKRTIWYLIESNGEIAGIGNGVEFCVSGFDRWKAYDGACRIVR